MANRLKQVLPEIISEEQNCSIPNRTIFNNLFLIRDIITYTKEKNNHFYLLQVDQEKAFDKIDRIFLFKTMEKMGISPIFINFIKTLYKQNTSMITNNGFLSEQIPLQRGLRQGCPLSLPLYVIQGEVTTININNNNSIKTKISQYADDSNLFMKDQESLNKVLQFFEKLNKATGITINLEKITVLPINTEDTAQIKSNTPKITIKEQFQTIKILGIHFNKNLKHANEMNWEITLKKWKTILKNYHLEYYPYRVKLYL